MAEAYPTYFEELDKLAQADRSQPRNPFGRVPDTNRVTYADMQMREGDLLAVLEIMDDKLAFHTELFSGQADKGAAIETDDYLGRLPISYLRTWLQRLAGLYALQEPSRKYYYKGEKVEEDHERWQIVERIEEVYRENNINGKLRRCDEYAVMCGNAALHPFYDSDDEELVINVYPSPYIRVANNRNNPKRPKGVILWGCDYERQGDAYARADTVAVSNAWRRVGKDVDFAQFRGGKQQEDWRRLPLDRIPVTHVFDADPEPRTGYYIPARGHLICHQSMLINNDFLATLGQAAVMQGFSVLVVEGLGGEVQLKIGPGRHVRFDDPDPDGVQDVRYVTPNAPLQEMLDLIRDLIREIERSHGIPESSINVETDASGAAIVQAQGGLAEMRNARKAIFRPVETDLLRNVLSVLNAYENGFSADDPSDWDVHVEYEQAQASSSTQDQIARDNHLLGLGVTTAAEIAMREKPGAFDGVEEAQAFIDANIQTELNPQPENTAGEEEVIVPDDTPDGDGLFDEADEPEEEDDA